MCGQLPYILQQESGRLLGCNHSGQIEKQDAPLIRKPPPRADNAERLAGKSCHYNVMVGHIICLNHSNIAGRRKAKVVLIGAPSLLVNVARENAPHA